MYLRRPSIYFDRLKITDSLVHSRFRLSDEFTPFDEGAVLEGRVHGGNGEESMSLDICFLCRLNGRRRILLELASERGLNGKLVGGRRKERLE